MADAGAAPPTLIASQPIFSGNGTTIRALTHADAAFDRNLFDEDRGAQFAPLGLDHATLSTLLDQQYHAQQMGTRSAFPDAEHFVIEHGGQAAGRLTTSLTSESESRALHVIALVLSASLRGRGIGTDVLNYLGDAALAQGATRLTLSVLRSNNGARRLYARLGFCVYADRYDSAHIAMVKLLA